MPCLGKGTTKDENTVENYIGMGQAKPDTRINTDTNFHFSRKRESVFLRPVSAKGGWAISINPDFYGIDGSPMDLSVTIREIRAKNFIFDQI
jgi:hypothetical protein